MEYSNGDWVQCVVWICSAGFISSVMCHTRLRISQPLTNCQFATIRRYCTPVLYGAMCGASFALTCVMLTVAVVRVHKQSLIALLCLTLPVCCGAASQRYGSPSYASSLRKEGVAAFASAKAVAAFASLMFLVLVRTLSLLPALPFHSVQID